jgi:hypothetical protein
MMTYLGNLFLLSDHEEVVSFEELNKTEDTTGFLALGVFGKDDLVFFDGRSCVANSLAHRFSQVLKIYVKGCFCEDFYFFHYNVLKSESQAFDIGFFINSNHVELFFKFIRSDDHKLRRGFENPEFAQTGCYR